MERVPAPAEPWGGSSAGLFMAFRGGERRRLRCRRALTRQNQPVTGPRGPHRAQHPLPSPQQKYEGEEEERGGRSGQRSSTSQRNEKSRSTSSSSHCTGRSNVGRLTPRFRGGDATDVGRSVAHGPGCQRRGGVGSAKAFAVTRGVNRLDLLGGYSHWQSPHGRNKKAPHAQGAHVMALGSVPG